MSRFLVRAKACHEKGLFGRSGRLAYPSQKNTLLNVLRVQSRGDFSAQYNLFIPAYLEISGGPGDWLIPSKKMSSGRTAMYSPEGIFPLGITHSSRPAAKLNKKVFRPERTVCVQSRGDFSARYNLFIPACHKKGLFGRSSVLSGVIRLISEPPRTEYSGEPEMRRFLVRQKACHEKFRTVRAHKQKKKSRKNQIKRFFLLFASVFSEMLFAESTPCHLVEMAKT